MIKSTASELLSLSQSNAVVTSPNDLEDGGCELLDTEANLDYLCNLSPHRYEAFFADVLPESLLGEDFLAKYGNYNDPVTVIDPKRSYNVKAAARHPIYENFCVKAFKALVTSTASDDQLTALGELLYQCHYSYSACGLGSDGTDRIVELVQEMQHCKSSKPEDTAVYGAKITGGGSEGTVCIISRNSIRANQQILEIQQKHKSATGHLPFVIGGSSQGAGKFGYLKVRLTSRKRVSCQPFSEIL